MDGRKIKGKIRFYIYKNDLGYETGDELAIDNAKLTIPDGVTNPDGFDFNAYLWRNGTALTASANYDKITLVEKHASLKRTLFRLRNRLCSVCDEVFGDQSDVMKAVLLGDRSSLSDNTYDDFSSSGISHLIALSGLHVSALALMIELLLKKLRVPRLVRDIVTVTLLSLYTVMTGASNSTIRAVLMYTILCATRQTGYYSDTLTRLCWALLIQLGVNPLLLHDNGFVLSYASVGSILCLADLYMFSDNRKNRFLKSMLLSAKASFSVQVVTFPLLAGMFYRVPLLSVPVNVLCVPLAVLALYTGVVVLLIGCIYAPIAAVVAYPVTLVWRFIKAVSGYVSSLSFAGADAKVWPVWLIVMFLAALLYGCMYVTKSRARRLIALGLMAVIIAVSLIPKKPIDHLRITFLSVGEADGAVFDAQGSIYVLDCGKDNGIVADYLTAHGAKVKGVLVSHADADHYGGSADILKRYPNAVVYLPECWISMNITDELSTLFDGRTIRYVSAGDSIPFSDDVHAEVLWPPKGFTFKDDNCASLVVNVVYNDTSILMMGDLPDQYDAQGCVDADILKIAHHGSKNATTEEMLRIVTPEIAVISVGNNGYGHPTDEVLRRLADVGALIYRTDEYGAITMDIYPDGTRTISTVLEPEE